MSEHKTTRESREDALERILAETANNPIIRRRGKNRRRIGLGFQNQQRNARLLRLCGRIMRKSI